MARKITTDIIINEFIGVHGDRYDYSLVEYISSQEKVKIICKEHGVFYQTPSKHKLGQKCPKCRGLNKTTQDIIKEFKLVHGETYDYSYVNYTKCNVKIDIKCKLHGIFHQSATDHLKGNGCPKCGTIKRILNKKINTNKKRNWSFKQPVHYKLIPLENGLFTKVDNEDFNELKKINWYLGTNGYVYNRNEHGLMHRFIMKCPNNKVVDHINHDKLDNRKKNLRICLPKENSRNQKVRDEEGKTSIYKGVSWSSRYKKWICQVVRDKKTYHKSIHENELDAALMYDKKAIEAFKEFAYLNFT